jgi:hypothetical protein
LIDFGLPVPLAAPLGILLPLAELAFVAALIPASTAWWGALGALALLLLFVAGIGFNLPAVASPTATALASYTPPRPGGRPSHVMRSSPLWPALSSGRGDKVLVRAP